MLAYVVVGALFLVVGAVLWQKYGAKARADELLLQQKYTGVKNEVKAEEKKVEDKIDYFV